MPKYFTDENGERRTKERRTGGLETEKKQLVLLDSNIFMLHGRIALFQYGKNDIYLSKTVQDELEHEKKDKRKIGENVRQTNALFVLALQEKTPDEIKRGIPLEKIAPFVFGEKVRVNATGRIFFQSEDSKNNPELFGEDFKNGEIVGIVIRMKSGEEKTISVSPDNGKQITKALRNKNDREILLIAHELQNAGERVLLITDDNCFLSRTILEGIPAEKYRESIQITQKKARKRPGRKTSQRNQEWN